MAEKLNIKPIGMNEGTVHNIDGDATTYVARNFGGDLTDLESKLRQWFDYHYKDCGISDILYCPSMSVRQKGVHPDVQFAGWETNERKKFLHYIYTQTDIDPYQFWFAQCREYGIKPWLSFRMNDVHYADGKVADREKIEQFPENDFFFKALDNGWMIGNERYPYWSVGATRGSRNWYQYALNFAIPEVRQHALEVIDSQLEWFDVDGIELDWQRQIWCFPEDSIDNCKHMNELMEGVREIIAKYEKIYGHKIELLVKASRDIDESKYFGLDIRHYADMGWIDVVVPSCYWGSSDSDMPIEKWVTELAKCKNKVQVWAGLECHVTNAFETEKGWQSASTLAGFATQYLSQGADKIYLFNMFNDVREKTAACSSLENALAQPRRSYVVTEANCTPYNVGFTEYNPLPIDLKAGETNDSIVIKHGPMVEDANNVIFVGIPSLDPTEIDAKTLTVKYNGAECEFAGITTESWQGESTYLGLIVGYKVPKGVAVGSKAGKISITAGRDVTCTYLELANGNIEL